MPSEAVNLLVSGLIAILAAAAGTRWSERRTQADKDTRAVRKVARELYRELDSASRRLDRIERARTYGELWKATPTIRRWPKLRVILADHALELIWMELAYTIDRMQDVDLQLREVIWQEKARSTDLVPPGEQKKVRLVCEVGMRASLGILEVLLPSDTPSQASRRLEPCVDAREQQKIRQQQALVRRELAKARFPGRMRAIARSWDSIWSPP